MEEFLGREDGGTRKGEGGSGRTLMRLKPISLPVQHHYSSQSCTSKTVGMGLRRPIGIAEAFSRASE